MKSINVSFLPYLTSVAYCFILFFSQSIKCMEVQTELELNQAALDGDVRRVQGFLNAGAEVMSKDEFGGTPLHGAANNGHDSVCDLLLDNGASVNDKNKYGNTPLHLTALKGLESTALLLVRRGADKSLTNNANKTAEDLARQKNNLKFIAALNSPLVQEEETLELHAAVVQGSVQRVRALLNAGVDVGELNIRGETALHIAARKGDELICDLLMKNGVDKTVRNHSGETAYDIANKGKKTAVLGLLLQQNAVRGNLEVGGQKKSAMETLSSQAPVQAPSFPPEMPAQVSSLYTDLFEAVRNGSLSSVNILISQQADVNQMSTEGTPLHVAAFKGHDAICEALVKAGARKDAVNGQLNMPLHLAAKKGHLSTCRLLVSLGAYKLGRNKQNKTPLDLARDGGYLEVCALWDLTTSAAPKQASSNEPSFVPAAPRAPAPYSSVSKQAHNKTPFVPAAHPAPAPHRESPSSGAASSKYQNILQAVAAGDRDAVAMFLDQGVSVETTDSEGNHLLHLAAQANSEIICSTLLKKYRANINATNNKGETALHVAVEHEYDKIIRLLCEAGIDVTIKDHSNRTASSWALQEDGGIEISDYIDSFEPAKQKSVEKKTSSPKAHSFVLASRPAAAPVLKPASTVAAESIDPDLAFLDDSDDDSIHKSSTKKDEYVSFIGRKIGTESYEELKRLDAEGFCNFSEEVLAVFLISAANKGNNDGVRYLIEKGVNVNAQERAGVTIGDYALLYAARKGWSETCRLLLENGADMNLENKQKASAASAAANSNKPEIKAVFEEFKQAKSSAQRHQHVSSSSTAERSQSSASSKQRQVDSHAASHIPAPPTATVASSATHGLATESDVGNIGRAIQRGYNWALVSDAPVPPVPTQRVIDTNSLKIERQARTLIPHRYPTQEELNSAYIQGKENNLHKAFRKLEKKDDTNAFGYKSAVRKIISAMGECPLDARGAHGETALMLACGRSHQADFSTPSTRRCWPSGTVANDLVNNVFLLLTRDVKDVNARDAGGNTALMYLVQVPIDAQNCTCIVAAVKLLIEKGADVSTVDNWGNTALFLATRQNGCHPEIIKLLLAAGAKVNQVGIIQNHEGNVACIPYFNLCAMNPNHKWNQECRQILLDAGTEVNFCTDTGDTFLTISARNYKYDVMADIVPISDTINHVNKLGHTALSILCANLTRITDRTHPYRPTSELIKLLLSHKADPTLIKSDIYVMLDDEIKDMMEAVNRQGILRTFGTREEQNTRKQAILAEQKRAADARAQEEAARRMAEEARRNPQQHGQNFNRVANVLNGPGQGATFGATLVTGLIDIASNLNL